MVIDTLGKINEGLSKLKFDLTKLNSTKRGTRVSDVLEIQKQYVDIKAVLEKLTNKDLFDYYIDQVKKDLVEVGRGRNYTNSIEGHTKKLKEIFKEYGEVKSASKLLSEDIEVLLAYIQDKGMSKNAGIASTLDKVASSLEGKGYLKEAEQLDLITNTIEANVAKQRSNIIKTKNLRKTIEQLKGLLGETP